MLDNPLQILGPTELGRKLGVTRQRAHQILNSDQNKAREAVHAALRTGKLTKPLLCSRCGSVGSVEAHHDDYRKRLEIRWLCTTCHCILHPHGRPRVYRYCIDCRSLLSEHVGRGKHQRCKGCAKKASKAEHYVDLVCSVCGGAFNISRWVHRQRLKASKSKRNLCSRICRRRVHPGRRGFTQGDAIQANRAAGSTHVNAQYPVIM